jgi:hypothetical protein
MGRATEFYHFINLKVIDKEEKVLYTNLTITENIEKIRKESLHFKKTGLIPNKDGTNRLF